MTERYRWTRVSAIPASYHGRKENLRHKAGVRITPIAVRFDKRLYDRLRGAYERHDQKALNEMWARAEQFLPPVPV